MSTKPTLHVVAPFHTVPSDEFSHCAFTGKAMRFAAMLQAHGYNVVEYSNEGSESGASEIVQMLTREELDLFCPRKPSDFVGDHAKRESPVWNEFMRRLFPALRKRVEPNDLICHPFGQATRELVQGFPDIRHVETGIGYPDAPFGCTHRIFESEAWRHVHLALYGSGAKEIFSSSVIPNYYDPNYWQLGAPDHVAPYVLMMGRIDSIKGVDTYIRAARLFRQRNPGDPLRFVIAGQGDVTKFKHHEELHYVGPVHGKDRVKLIGEAFAVCVPSAFVEPFGGIAAEALLCGVPVLATRIGGLTEVVQEDDGQLLHPRDDWGQALDSYLRAQGYGAGQSTANAAVTQAWRLARRNRATGRFSLAACGLKYADLFAHVLP